MTLSAAFSSRLRRWVARSMPIPARRAVAAAMRAAKGSFDLVLNTIPSEHDYTVYTALVAKGGKHIVLGAHGGVINAYLSDVLGTDEDMFFLPTHTAISRVVLNDEIRVIRSINEHQHLGESLLTY